MMGDRAIALGWIEACNRNSGIYWTVNLCRPNLMKKAQKQDVRLLRAVWADLDPLDDPRLGERVRTWQEERERLRLLALELEKLELPPTVLIDSGNGVQAIWRLADPIEANDEYIIEIERLGRRIECSLGGLENTSNVDRVLRLPARSTGPTPRSAAWVACRCRPASCPRPGAATPGRT
jgi:Mesyanzhinovviridae DNA primase